MLLEIKHIAKNFGGVVAIDDFSLEIDKGQIQGIIGPNGAGKTTIFNVVTGVYPTDRGQIFLDGKDITNMPQHQIARAGISRTFQNIRLFQGLNVRENVMCAFDPQAKYGIIGGLLPTPARIREERRGRRLCEEILKEVGLLDYAEEKPGNLSYGLQRRLEIGRALMTHPKVLLLDEPAAGLNPTEVADLTCLIQELSVKRDLAVLLIEHRLELVMSISERIHVQNFGKTICIGTPKEVQNNPEVIEAYIGKEE